MKRQMVEHDFKLGDRVCLSQLGKDRIRKQIIETGTVLGRSNRTPSTVRVLFDGLKGAKSLHKTYIEPLRQEMTLVLENRGGQR